jgi:hypothetical protein
MLNLVRLTEDIIDDRELTNDNLRNFVEDFLLRLILAGNNPGGVYNTMITDTTLLYNNFFGKMSSEATAIAIREGLTVGKGNAKKLVFEKLSNLQGLVVYKFGKDGAVYQEFYPQGMEEYYQSRQDDLKVILDRFLTAATTHLTTDHPTDVVDVTTKINNYKASLNLKISTEGEIETLKTGRREDRKALTRKMSLNFLQLAIDHFENPDAFDNYYNPRYLPLNVPAQPDAVRTGNVAANSQLNVPLSGVFVTPNTNIKFTNTINTVGSILTAQFASAPDAAFDSGRSSVAFESLASEPQANKASEAGYDAAGGFIYLILYANNVQAGFRIEIEQ